MASLVPCGIASPLPMNVETDCSRSCMEATYASSTAPASTSRWPASSIAASRSLAVPPSTIELASRMSISTSSPVSAGDDGAARPALDCVDELDDLVVPRAAHEVVDGDVDRRRGLLHGPVGQVLVGDHQVVGVGQVGDRLVDDGDLAVTGRLDLLAQHRGAHGRGAHARVAGEHDRPDLLGRPAAQSGRRRPRTSCPSSPPCPPWRPSGRPRPAPCRASAGSRPPRSETAAAETTDRVTPTRLDAGACSHTAMIEPGAAGARRPESKSRLVATPVMPPRITARTSFGFISTYGK